MILPEIILKIYKKLSEGYLGFLTSFSFSFISVVVVKCLSNATGVGWGGCLLAYSLGLPFITVEKSEQELQTASFIAYTVKSRERF